RSTDTRRVGGALRRLRRLRGRRLLDDRSAPPPASRRPGDLRGGRRRAPARSRSPVLGHPRRTAGADPGARGAHLRGLLVRPLGGGTRGVLCGPRRKEMTTISFDGRVAIVTGAGGGLGRAYALELARRGAAVVVNDIGGTVDGTGSSTRAADAVVDEIRAAGGDAVADYGSVADPEQAAQTVRTAIESFGSVDAVVSNAGNLRDRSFGNMTLEEVNAVLDVHLRGAFHIALPACGHMKEQGYGRFVFVSSNAGLLGNFGQ